MYKIGYIDEDKGWCNTFYQYFKSDFEVITFEINGSTSVESLVKEVDQNSLDALIIDFRLDESGLVNFNGNTIVERILKNKPHFPLIILTSFEQDAIDHVENVNIINAKDLLEGEKPEKVDVLKAKIQTNINNYYLRIKKAESRIEELITKRNKKQLDSKEEEELTKLYIYLDEIDPNDKTIPANLIKPESISQLNEFVAQTREILQQLKKSKK